ncbi:MAG: toxin [Myxococcales bacterium]|nr:toxin [Myxococcales bacterium]
MRPAFARVCATLVRRAMPVAALAGMAGCAVVLGFEDTTVRTGGDGGTVDGGGPGNEGGTPNDSGASHLSVKPTSLVLRRGGSADLTVDLARGAELTGTVTARLSGLPAGVAAAPATLAPAATTAIVHLTALASATLGPATITLDADGSGLPSIPIPLLVADPAGSLDVTFDADGHVSDPSRGVGSTFLALAVQPDGQIIAAGGAAAMGATLAGWVIRRYAANGVPDTAFNAQTGAAGVSPVEGQAQAVAVDGKGNIVCVGFTLPAPGRQLTIVRLLPSGALDKTFGGTGIVRLPTEVPATASFGLGVAVQPDGAIVVAGSRRDTVGTTESGIVTRFLENGARDTTFNAGATIAVAGARFVGVALDGDGLLVGGSTIGGALPSYFATRRSARGVVDPTFGSGGTAAFGNTYRANAFARLADGSIALVGDIQQGSTAGYTAGVATPKGVAVFARAYGNAAGAGFFGIAVQADGQIIAAGHTATTNGEARVERILPDGNKDGTFGTAGTATIEAAGTANGIDVTLFAAAVQADGRILTAGNRTNAGAVIYRLWP